MNLYDALSFVQRLAVLVPILFLLGTLLGSFIRRKHLNGLTATRNAIIALCLGVGIEFGIRLIGDIHVLAGLSKTSQEWLASTKWVIFVARWAVVYGFARFASLFILNDGGEHK